LVSPRSDILRAVALRPGAKLPRSFYARSSPEVARDLLGRVLVRNLPGGLRLSGRIVEAEAYQEDDPASHSYRGPTPRTEVMFGPPGHVYVYFTYGMHFCMNVVTGTAGEGSAVLLRAAEPLEGLMEMTRRRGTRDPKLLLGGPARLCQAIGVARAENGLDLVRGSSLHLEAGVPVPDDLVEAGPRIGIRSGIERAWRFSVKGSPFVSRRRPGAVRERRAARPR
jgi:DNA-3-methyladenine glycosylase